MNYAYRRAKPDDAATCLVVRGKTRENAYSEEDLKAIGITVESLSDGIRDGTLSGYVCLKCNTIIGYCFGARDSGEISVLALLPIHENRGVGKTLLELMISDFKSRGFKRLFLGCSTNAKVRSYSFYRHLGWQSTGILDVHDDEILEFFLDLKRRNNESAMTQWAHSTSWKLLTEIGTIGQQRSLSIEFMKEPRYVWI